MTHSPSHRYDSIQTLYMRYNPMRLKCFWLIIWFLTHPSVCFFKVSSSACSHGHVQQMLWSASMLSNLKPLMHRSSHMFQLNQIYDDIISSRALKRCLYECHCMLQPEKEGKCIYGREWHNPCIKSSLHCISAPQFCQWSDKHTLDFGIQKPYLGKEHPFKETFAKNV